MVLETILIVFHQRQGEDLVHHHLVLPRLPQLFQLLFQLFRPGKAVDEENQCPFIRLMAQPALPNSSV